MAHTILFRWLIVLCIALQSLSAAYAIPYVDSHKDDPTDITAPTTDPKPPPAPPMIIEGKTRIKPKQILEIPFHLSPYESMRQAEFSEKNVRTEVSKVEANYPKAVYMVTFYLPILRTGPMQLPRDPNIYLSAIMNEIKELKVPPARAKSGIQYVNLLRAPRIILYCYKC